MKIDYKNPMLYYIMVPVLAGLWAVLAGSVFYPNSVKACDETRYESEDVDNQIKRLVDLQPERLAFKVEKKASEDFDFTKTINEFAQKYSISPSNYNLNVRGEARKSGMKTRSASISIKNIDIEKMAQFLSDMLFRWPDLKCENLGIEKVKNSKNNWKVDMKLTYYFSESASGSRRTSR